MIARPDVSFQCFETKLCGRVTPRTAGHPRMHFQPEPAVRRLIARPRRHQKEPLADHQRRPRLARYPFPIGAWLLSELRRELGKTIEQPARVAVILEESADAWAFLRYPCRALLP